MSRSHREVVTELSGLIDRALDPLVPRGARVALLDFPNHNNVGDNAIWLGETEYLRRRGARVVYACDHASYSRRALADRLGTGDDGIVLLHGGGNFGTVWPLHQAFRERVVSELSGHRIVQLPQTVDFADGESAARARAVLSGHPRLTVLARDHESLGFLSGTLGLEASLCPDMAFALGCSHRLEPVRDLLWLARSDHEAAGAAAGLAPGEGEVVDWLVGEPDRPWSTRLFSMTVRGRRLAQAALRRSDGLRRLAAPFAGGVFERLARRRFERGRRILSRGRVVVTDRLHGHVLSLLFGIPHVFLDNRFGKLRRFHATFDTSCDLNRQAGDPGHALELARGLVRSGESA